MTKLDLAAKQAQRRASNGARLRAQRIERISRSFSASELTDIFSSLARDHAEWETEAMRDMPARPDLWILHRRHRIDGTWTHVPLERALGLVNERFWTRLLESRQQHP